MLRVDRDVLLDSVTMDVLDGGNELVVATYTAGRLLEPEAAARDRWEPYARAARHAASRGLRLPGQSDSDVVLERFVLCQDGLYHRTDVYDHKSHIFLTPMQVDSEFRPMLENARAMAAGAGRSPEPVGDGVAALDGRSPDGFEGEDAAPPAQSAFAAPPAAGKQKRQQQHGRRPEESRRPHGEGREVPHEVLLLRRRVPEVRGRRRVLPGRR